MFTLNCKGRLWEIDSPVVMGILNITPDSFYADSRRSTIDDALQTAEKMLRDGAGIIDVGGQSTRPGSTILGSTEETERVLPVIDAINRRFPGTIISIDTYHADTASAAVEAGASIVNDISGGNFDGNMIATVAGLHVPYICMHIKGSPGTIHADPQYSDVTTEVLDYFIAKKAGCERAGIHDLIIDPGFGFSKNSQHNFQLLKDLEVFQILGNPILVGISRKSTICKTLGVTAGEALNGTTVLNTAALLKGAMILRVHDVKEAVEAVKLTEQLR